MVIVSSDGLKVVHFENLLALKIVEFSGGKAELLAQVAEESEVVLAKNSLDYCKHLLNGILQANYDNVKILYLPEKEKTYGLAISGTDAKEGVRGFGVPENPMPLNPSNIAESFSSIRSKVRNSTKKKGGSKC